MDWTKKKVISASVVGLFVIGAIGSAGEDQSSRGGSSDDRAAATAAPSGGAVETTVAEPAATPQLNLQVPDDRDVFRDKVTVAGRVSVDGGASLQGVSVKVDGKTAPVNGGRWSKTVTVKPGDNTIDIDAAGAGFEDDSAFVVFTRKRSQAEKAAVAAKQRAAAAAKKANFLASAKSIPYNQLDKNADRYSGDRVVFRGQIMQIQEDYGSTVILLSVTDEGYGYWTDNIWVDYDGTIKGAEDDIITVYGTIDGTKSYETQIGGETYVPQMTAKYVAE